MLRKPSKITKNVQNFIKISDFLPPSTRTAVPAKAEIRLTSSPQGVNSAVAPPNVFILLLQILACSLQHEYPYLLYNHKNIDRFFR